MALKNAIAKVWSGALQGDGLFYSDPDRYVPGGGTPSPPGTFNVADVTATDAIIEIPPSGTAKNFRIQRSTDGTTWENFALVPTNLFIANGLTPSTQYWWRYREEDEDGGALTSFSSSINATQAPIALARRLPNFPQAFVNLKYVAIGSRAGTTRTVGTGKTYSTTQAAIDAAARGDTVLIDAGYDGGPIVLRNKAGTGTIYIETTAVANLPTFWTGGYVTPANVAHLARVSGGQSNVPVITAENSASDYRLVGLHVQCSDAVTFLNNLTEFTPSKTATNLFANKIIFDRCWLNTVDEKNCVRASWFDVVEGGFNQCYLSGFKNIGQDTQAIIIVGTPGPQVYRKCYIEGAAENFMSGGTNANIVGVQPADISFIECEFTKQTWWLDPSMQYTATYTVKNNFEMKSGERFLLHRCTLRNQWPAGQAHAIVLTTRTEGGASHWYSVKDVTFYDMLALDIDQLFNVHALDDVPAQQSGESTRRVLVRNVLWVMRDWGDVRARGVGSFRGFQILGGNAAVDLLDMTFEHITMVDPYNHYSYAPRDFYNAYMIFFGDVGQSDRLTCRSNIFQTWGSGSSHWNGLGNGLAQFLTYDVQKNVVGYKAQGTNPANNYYVTNLGEIGFTNHDGGNFALATGSTYKGQGFNGRDPGADFSRIPTFSFPTTTDVLRPTFADAVNITGLTSTACTVNWPAATDAGGIKHYLYRVYYTDVADFAAATIQRGKVSNATTSVAVTGLAAGRPCAADVWAVDNTGNHKWRSVAFTTP